MATISKANRPRKAPGMTRNGRVSLKSLSVEKLKETLDKTSQKKLKSKIENFIKQKEAKAKKV